MTLTKKKGGMQLLENSGGCVPCLLRMLGGECAREQRRLCRMCASVAGRKESQRKARRVAREQLWMCHMSASAARRKRLLENSSGCVTCLLRLLEEGDC